MFEWIYKCVEFEINIEFRVIINEKYEREKKDCCNPFYGMQSYNV